MNSLELSQLMAQTQIQTQQPSNSLIDTSGEDVVYIGIGALIVLIILVVGILSRRVASAIIMALILTAIIFILVIAI